MMASMPEIIGYRRIFDGGCDHCRVAAQKLYHKSDLMPMHENCECGIAPVFAGDVPTDVPFHAKGVGIPDPQVGVRLDQTIDLPDAEPMSLTPTFWLEFSPVEQAEYLKAHPDIEDAAWTSEKRKPDENRSDFIDRILLALIKVLLLPS